MKKLIASGFVLLALAGVLGVASGARNANAATQTVTVADDTFTPGTLTVNVGDTVDFNWAAGAVHPHNVTWDSGSPGPSNTQSSGTYSRTFSAAGTFAYHCSIHGAPGAGMFGTITVQQAAAPTATNTPVATATAAATRTGTVVANSTANATATGAATLTPVATVSVQPPVLTPTPPNTIAPVATSTLPGGGTGAGVTAPNTGSGPESGGGSAALRWLSIALAAAGLGAIAAAIARGRAT